MRNRKFLFIFIISFVILNCFIIMDLKAASYTFYVSNSTCNVRIGPGTNYKILQNDNSNVQIRPNQNLEYVNLKNGTVNGNNGQWYEVKFDYAAKEYDGYVWSNCVTVKNASYSDDSAFENKISTFPESYKPYLRKIHALHNNWEFEVDNTNLDWNKSVSAESEKGVSAVSNLYPSLFFKDKSNPNGIIIDGNNWYAACKDAVAYYMDPRNFLEEKSIFMFQKLSYDANEDSSVKTVLKGSFMENYADYFISAGKQSGVSSVYLASLSLQEMGTKVSSASSGKTPGYEGYYNFYNIGATSGTDNYIKGLQYAKNAGWNSVEKAIVGGAKVVGANYISVGQDTIYFKKYNTSSNRTRNAYAHQYQTNIMAPKTESQTMYSSYSANNKLGRTYIFKIPVYNAMPMDAFKLSSNGTIGGNDPVVTTQTTTKTTINNGSNNNTTESVSSKVAKAGYKISGNYLSGVYGNNIANIKSNLEKKGASVSLLSKTSGTIGTGNKVQIDGKVYEAVIYGDISGDGKISAVDLLNIKQKLLGTKKLSGAYSLSADVNKDGKISATDLMLVKKQLLGQYKISQ